MGCLVNPLGWRLGVTRHWNTQLFVFNDSAYAAAINKAHVLNSVLDSYLRLLIIRWKPRKKRIFYPTTTSLAVAPHGFFLVVRVKFRWFPLLFRVFKADPYEMLAKAQVPGFETTNRPSLLYRQFRRKRGSPKTRQKILSFLKALGEFNPKATGRHKDRKMFRRFRNLNKPFKWLFLMYYLYPLLQQYRLLLMNLFLHIFQKKLPLRVWFVSENERTINAQIALNYLASRLRKRRMRIRKVIFKFTERLSAVMRRSGLLGFKFLFSGRISRRDRATYIWKRVGAVPLNTRTANIEYAHKILTLKQGICIVKIWLCHR